MTTIICPAPIGYSFPNQAIVKIDGIWRWFRGKCYGRGYDKMFRFVYQNNLVEATVDYFLPLRDDISENEAYDLVCSYNIASIEKHQDEVVFKKPIWNDVIYEYIQTTNEHRRRTV